MAMLGLVACEQEAPFEAPPAVVAELERDPDVLIIGAGLAGLSAAIDAASAGARVLVIDMNSVFGGHEQAYNDWMDWAVDGQPEWTRFYAENSREMIYDWVTGLGVRFDRVQLSHGNSVPRFHMTSQSDAAAVPGGAEILQYHLPLERERGSSAHGRQSRTGCRGD